MRRTSFTKALLVACGCTAVVLGVAGIFLPLLPTTPFLLLAAACFVRSSDRLYRWLLAHRWLGPYIRNYREHRAITRTSKIVMLVLLWLTISLSAFLVIQHLWIRVLLMAIATGVTVHILLLKTLTPDMLSAEPTDEKAASDADRTR